MDLEERAGTQAATIAKDLHTLLDAVKTYAKFERAFTSPERTSPQEYLEEYKDKNMSTQLGRAWQIRKDKLKAKKEALSTWVEDEDIPPVGIKSSASSRDPARIHGIQHTKAPTKKMREKLNHKRNQLKKMDQAWERHKYVNFRAYRLLEQEIEKLALESDAASWEKGEPFKDSFGDYKLVPEPTEANLVAIALHLYRQRRQ